MIMWKWDANRTQVMGILNTTPDSFSDGGLYHSLDKALFHAETMIKEGVDIIDIGGESTRPGAESVPLNEELARVIPLLEKLRQHFDIPISVDTSKQEVMQQAIQAGADLINDVYALREPGALEICASSHVRVCLMHMQGEPRTMQSNPHYEDVVQEVFTFLAERIDACERVGIEKQRLILDPGFGFGKTLAHNIQLMQHLPTLHALHCPLLVGVSRKSMIGALLNNRPINERKDGSVAAAIVAMLKGAAIVRVHDVKATVDAFSVMRALN
jgi:dihydropteroate synthase